MPDQPPTGQPSRLLTDAERDRFATYLEQDAESTRLLLQQFEGLPHGIPLAAKLKQELAAMLIIARKLRSIESMTLGEKP